ncbi:hypothetical protein Tfu_2966 [Thermobifida fusca YX]|jgi:hypothetical protein|nr:MULTISPECIES: hypothetical protein [Thermobifida]AAZ56999.1 hypothetical protein Tfu_2966 [Thermobifida fusca YX]MBO2530050.1 hypothetical protein [Thermobifida sp.]MDD6790710.1 hypothetical protein [Thermobifida fusca]PPS94934.1 hypothetical protein BH05_04060 [Thermobifida fusca]PZN65722.1 MAG: hypothetical protein DIU53_03240 [Thermobifida fusca]
MKKMRLRKPVLVAAAAAATTAAVWGVLMTTHAAFTARTATGPLAVAAGRLDVELTTSRTGQNPIRVDLSEVGPDRMWPPDGALTVSLRNTGTLDGVISALETVEVVDDSPAGSAELSRALEIAVSTNPAQNWHDPALTWERVAGDAAPSGRVVASELGSLPVGEMRAFHVKLRFVGEDDAASYAGATTSFRLAATVSQAL